MKRLREFSRGFGALVRGFAFLASHPRLWVWALLPTLINLAILSAMLIAFVHYYGDVYAWLTAHIGRPDIADPQTWYSHLADALLWVANLLLQALLVLVSLIVLLVVAYALSFVVAGPFNDALSERVETLVTGDEPPPFKFAKFLADVARTVRIEAVKAAILVAIPVVLFALNLIPILGGALYVILTILFGAWDLGFSYADIPNGRRVVPFSSRWRFARENRWAMMGLGAGFAIPFCSLIFAAPMVVG
nr:EI24 domain-containing protein [bacterium]